MGSGSGFMRREILWPLLAFIGVTLLLWALNASRVGTEVEGCLDGCVTADDVPHQALRVLSLNVLHGFPGFERLSTRLDLIADEIRRQEADVVCLQEVPWTWGLGSGAGYLARRVGFNHLYLRANGNRRTIFFEEGEAILSRYPLRDPGFVALKPRAGFFEHRVALHATAITPWGGVDVFVTHLTNADPEVNLGQAQGLMAFVGATAGEAAVVAGDFNAQEVSPQIRMLAREWVDAYRRANPNDEGLTCCVDDLAAPPGEPLEKRIDYVFAVPRGGRGVQVLSARRVLDGPFELSDGWQWASDHVGLLVELQVAP